MSDDPIQDLREQLLAAARRRQEAQVRTPSDATRRSPEPFWRRRSALAAGLALLVATPAVAAISGVIDVGGGSTPDGGTFTVGRTTNSAGAVCDETEFRDRSGELVARVRGCAPPGTTVSEPLSVGVIVAPRDSRLVSGTVSDRVATVSVTGIDGPVALRAIDGATRRFFQVITSTSPVTVTAFADDGTVLQTERPGP